jgi:hypothetical protein
VLQETQRVTRGRVCILEWPYFEGEFGPPLADRINPDDLVALAKKAGFAKIETEPLSNLVFYSLTQ